MKVLLFLNEALAEVSALGTPSTSRAWQLAKGLESNGIEVVISMPSASVSIDSCTEFVRSKYAPYLWAYESQDEVLRNVDPDAVIFAGGWEHYNLKKKPNVPLIIDLVGARFIEAQYENRGLSAERKVTVLSHADCLLCTDENQRLYYYGWLIQSGRFPQEQYIQLVPHGINPEPVQRKPHEHVLHKKDVPILISGGRWYPWCDPSHSLFAISKLVEKHNRGMLLVYGGPEIGSIQDAYARAFEQRYEQLVELSRISHRIVVGRGLSQQELFTAYADADVAIDIYLPTLWTELNSKLRAIEYLRAGLPVVSAYTGQLGEWIKTYDAGWIVDLADPSGVSSVISEVFSNPDKLLAKSENAQKLAREKFSWDKTVLPLVEYLQDPTQEVPSDPVLGTVYTRPSFLHVKGKVVDVPLGVENMPVAQRFCLPAEDISGVELVYQFESAEAKEMLERVEYSICRPDGSVIIRKSVQVSALVAKGAFVLRLPLLGAPAGGEELEFALKLEPSEKYSKGTTIMRIKGVLESRYPLIASTKPKLWGLEKTGNTVPVAALALNFIAADASAFYRLRVLSSRAVWMVKHGEWRRFFRALKRRVPQLIREVKN